MKLVKINKITYDDFVSNSPYHSYYQSSSYGQALSGLGLKDEYYGFEKDGTIVGAFLVLTKNSFLGFKYAYSPRGLIIDYTDSQTIKDVARELKGSLFKERYLFLKLDPLIIVSIKDKKGNTIKKNPETEQLIKNMSKAGFNHGGFNLGFEKVKPRFEFEIDINKSSADLFRNLTKQNRNKLRKATKYGVSVYKDNNPDFKKIGEFINNKNYNPKYFKRLKEQFGDDLEIYDAKLNTRQYVENSKKLYEKEMEINHYLSNIIQSHGYKGKKVSKVLSKKLESDKLLNTYKNHMVTATSLLRDYPEGLLVGITITLKHLDKVYLLFEDYDKTYPNLCANYLSKWKIIEKYAGSEYKRFNMGAVTGLFSKEHPYKGLNEMKSSYNGEIIEYLGEFDLVINQAVYSLYKGMQLNKK